MQVEHAVHDRVGDPRAVVADRDRRTDAGVLQHQRHLAAVAQALDRIRDQIEHDQPKLQRRASVQHRYRRVLLDNHDAAILGMQTQVGDAGFRDHTHIQQLITVPGVGVIARQAQQPGHEIVDAPHVPFQTLQLDGIDAISTQDVHTHLQSGERILDLVG